MKIIRNDVGLLQLSRTETESYFQWKIDNFSTSCRKIGDYITSPKFLTSCYHEQIEWNLRLYSKGDTDATNYVSLYIDCVSEDKVKANITFSILDNNSHEICECKLEKQTFNGSKNKGLGWGFPKYVQRGFVMNKINNILSMNTLTILCKIICRSNCVSSLLPGDVYVKIVDGCMIDQTAGHHDDLESLFESGDYSDVTFLVDGKQIKAHKAIITSRCPVFKIMFELDMKEKKENVIEISDIKYHIMKELLRFIYASKVKRFQNYASQLLQPAEKYQIQRLKNLCEKELSKNIKFKNVFEKLVLADMCNAEFLKSRAIDFISKNLHVVIDNPEFKEFVVQHRRLMSDVIPGGVMKN